MSSLVSTLIVTSTSPSAALMALVTLSAHPPQVIVFTRSVTMVPFSLEGLEEEAEDEVVL